MSEELAVPVGNYRVKISVILTVVKILFSLQNGKRIGSIPLSEMGPFGEMILMSSLFLAPCAPRCTLGDKTN